MTMKRRRIQLISHTSVSCHTEYTRVHEYLFFSTSTTGENRKLRTVQVQMCVRVCEKRQITSVWHGIHSRMNDKEQSINT